MDDIDYLLGFAEHEEEIDELKWKLFYTTQEIEKLKYERIEEIKKNDEYVNNLIRVLNCALQQRNEALDQLQEFITKISTLVHQDSNVSISNDTFDPIMNGLIKGRVLPQRGMFKQAVLQAGPLLQSLLKAPMAPPIWRNPPPFQAFQGLSVGQFVGIDTSSLSYANFGCMKNDF